jgi:hypothetical protein
MLSQCHWRTFAQQIQAGKFALVLLSASDWRWAETKSKMSVPELQAHIKKLSAKIRLRVRWPWQKAGLKKFGTR